MTPADVWRELALYGREEPGDAATLARFRALLERTPAPFSHAQHEPGHLTCSACVLDAGARHVLLLHHAKLERWLQPGGHVEPGDASPLDAARRELAEESGLRDALPLAGPGGSAIVDVDVHGIPAHGAERAHLHFDLRVALAVPGVQPRVASDESHALRWIDATRVSELTREVSVTRLVARTLARAGAGREETRCDDPAPAP